MSVRTFVFLSVAALTASASLADPVPQTAGAGTPAQSAAKTPDPNEVICERQEETGSRLGAKRICMTRSQWAEQKSEDRQQLEHVQVQRGMYDPH